MIGAIILVVIGAVAMLVAHGAKVRRDAMAGTATVGCAEVASVASDGKAVPCEVVGVVGPSQKPLVSPLSGTSCVWYRTTVRRRYYDGHPRDDDTKTRREYVSKQTSSEPLTIRDSSGVTWLLPDGAEIDGETKTVGTFERFAPYETHAADGSFTQRAIRLGLKIRTQPDDRTLGYEFGESVLHEGSTLYVRAGAMRDRTGRAWLQKPANGPFLISTRGEAELMQRNRRVLFIALGVGAAAILGGLTWGIASLV